MGTFPIYRSNSFNLKLYYQVTHLGIPDLKNTCTKFSTVVFREIQLYRDMSLRVVTSTGAPSFNQFSVLFKFSISLIFLVLVKFKLPL
eukprot:SAG31_NODE_3344_length_4381_cov_3.492760_1_plen_88_part_00